MVKTLSINVIVSSFHVNTYFDQMQESLFNRYVLETLSGPSLIKIKHCQMEEQKIMVEVANLKKVGPNVAIDLTTKTRLLQTKGNGTGTRRTTTKRKNGGVIGKRGRIGKIHCSLGVKSGRKMWTTTNRKRESPYTIYMSSIRRISPLGT
jgi:hypothetical protein